MQLICPNPPQSQYSRYDQQIDRIVNNNYFRLATGMLLARHRRPSNFLNVSKLSQMVLDIDRKQENP